MADSYIKSPLEHGELDSPEYSPTNSPEIVVGVAGEEHSDDHDEDRSPRYQDEEELGPDIKPPQAKVKKEKHKSHKREKHKTRDRDKSDRYNDRRSDRGNKSSDGKRSAAVSYSRSQRSEVSHRERGSVVARGSDRRGNIASQGGQGERPLERERQVREDELTHRDRSNRERERLERLELERQRLDREIIRHEQQQRDKVQREQVERDRKQRSQVVRVKTKSSDGDKNRVITSNSSRQIDQESRREQGQSRSNVRRSRSPPNRRLESQSNRPKERPVQRSQRNDSNYADRGKPTSFTTDSSRTRADNDTYRSKTDDRDGRKKVTQKSLERVVEEIHSPGESGESESDSDSSSDDSDSDSESESEEDENKENEKSENNSGLPERVKSRFDSASENEAEASDHGSDHSDRESAVHSDHGGEYIDYLDETPPESPVELLPDLPPYLPAIQGCRNVDEFNCLHRIEEGTYGVVYQALDKKTDEVVALKRLKMEKEKEGFPITSLREINTLLKAQHPNIVTVREIVVGSNMDRIYIVMDYVEHDLKSLMEYRMKEPFTVGEVKTLIIQLLRGVAHLHDNWIIHRDLKTSNLLLSHAGILKIADFGLAREYGSPLKAYTPIVVTLWYRAPELLLGTKEYSCPIDLWSVGCIMAEFLTKKPLFPGKSEIDELNKIFKELGTPNEKIWPGVADLKGWKTCTFADYPYNQLRNRFGGFLTDKGFELINRFLTYNPAKRITAEEALKHPWFYTESPSPVEPSMFPTWPTKGEEHHHRKSGGNSPKPPSGGKAYSSLLADDSGFHLPGVASGGGFALKF